MSTFSFLPILEKQYPGQINPVTDLKFYFSEDFRPGFERHAIANISWTKPQGTNNNYVHKHMALCSQILKIYL